MSGNRNPNMTVDTMCQGFGAFFFILGYNPMTTVCQETTSKSYMEKSNPLSLKKPKNNNKNLNILQNYHSFPSSFQQNCLEPKVK